MTHSARPRFQSRTLLLAALTALIAGGPLSAQVLGGKPGARGDDKGARNRNNQNLNQPLASSGSFYGRIVKFTPVDDDEGDLLGTLSLRGYTRTNSSMRLKVFRNDESSISLGNLKIPVDDYAEMLAKGVQVNANWQVIERKDGKPHKKITRSTPKELVTLSFKTVNVQGKIIEVDGDVITIKVVPQNGMQWPDVQAKEADRSRHRTVTATNINVTPRKAKIRSRKLKLRVVDEVADLNDLEAAVIEVGDLEEEQLVEATVIPGYPKIGYVTSLRLVTELNKIEKEEEGGNTRIGGGDRGRRRTDG